MDDLSILGDFTNLDKCMPTKCNVFRSKFCPKNAQEDEFFIFVIVPANFLMGKGHIILAPCLANFLNRL